jgi:hypothetical protein
LFRVTHINRGDHRVVDARSDWFPIPATVAASEKTGTRSSAVHLSRAAQVNRNTLGRSSAQVFFHGPSGGAPSDQEGRSCYDCDAGHDSTSFCLWFSVVRFIRERPAQQLIVWRADRIGFHRYFFSRFHNTSLTNKLIACWQVSTSTESQMLPQNSAEDCAGGACSVLHSPDCRED